MKDIITEFDRPIVFRTVNAEVYESTINSGSIWLRSSDYYVYLEDKARCDKSEGANGTKTLLPLCFHPEGGTKQIYYGDGIIGQKISPHYIFSMHGSSVSECVRKDFGEFTFGIKCISRLSAEILYEASKYLNVTGYRFGQVSYQYTALCRSLHSHGAAVGLGGNLPEFLQSINTDVLRKDPVLPFIEQDEWRIVIFTNSLIKNDYNEPLKLIVNPNNFYEYKSSAKLNA
ncbi:hypothetical protein [Chlorobium phaeobacteroides]|uniref:Uncharacterized protein n=1 Tax=Chlorobium phaeobacteroides (strain DSM 266 / SMG 266 / 2430) TaxID=290317 RepID=A1BD64_CHLPD|nr:hypothetical protein [Chlorobium phaeobacteroides]ABL64341.1 hypothetical protein Cpha266_0277 [Chlorobium phaeobacteroides DSM 266]